MCQSIQFDRNQVYSDPLNRLVLLNPGWNACEVSQFASKVGALGHGGNPIAQIALYKQRPPSHDEFFQRTNTKHNNAAPACMYIFTFSFRFISIF